jgi:hypothetical protein
MFAFRHVALNHTIEEAAGLQLSYLDSGLGAVTRLGAGGVYYRRPSSVTVPGTASTVPIRDHVMTIRLVVAILLLLVNLEARRRGR